MLRLSTSPEAVLSSRFRFRDPALLCASLRLYADRLELRGWSLRGRYFRRIPLQRVLQADAPSADSLLLWLSDGETVRLQVKGTLRWKQSIEHQQWQLRNRISGPNTSQHQEVSP